MERQPGSGFFDDFAKLLHEARGGSRDAKDKLYLPYHTVFGRWAHQALGRELRPERDSDFVQGIFAVAWQSFEQFQGETEEEFTSWLKTIFRNELNQRFRFQHRKRRESSRAVPLDRISQWNLARETESPLEHLISKEEEQILDQALEDLPNEHILCLFLRFNCEETYEQMGRTLYCSAEAARKRYERAVAELERRLPAN